MIVFPQGPLGPQGPAGQKGGLGDKVSPFENSSPDEVCVRSVWAKSLTININTGQTLRL